MAYTEPTNLHAMLAEMSLKSHRRLVPNYTTLVEGERTGKRKISVVVPQRSTASDADGAFLTADEDNLIQTITCVDKAIRHAWPRSIWNTKLGQPNFIRSQILADADALGILMETALDTLLTSATNTISLATDNTFTLGEFATGLASLMQNGASLDEMVFLTGTAGFASLVSNGWAAAGGATSQIRGQLGFFTGGPGAGIPIITSAQCTISAATNGAAGYLWAKQAILTSMVDVDVIMPTPGVTTATVDMATSCAYGFAFAEGTGNLLTVKFINP